MSGCSYKVNHTGMTPKQIYHVSKRRKGFTGCVRDLILGHFSAHEPGAAGITGEILSKSHAGSRRPSPVNLKISPVETSEGYLNVKAQKAMARSTRTQAQSTLLNGLDFPKRG